jgi:hypothetical protein
MIGKHMALWPLLSHPAKRGMTNLIAHVAHVCGVQSFIALINRAESSAL